jgi:hypothetical protein
LRKKLKNSNSSRAPVQHLRAADHLRDDRRDFPGAEIEAPIESLDRLENLALIDHDEHVGQAQLLCAGETCRLRSVSDVPAPANVAISTRDRSRARFPDPVLFAVAEQFWSLWPLPRCQRSGALAGDDRLAPPA